MNFSSSAFAAFVAGALALALGSGTATASPHARLADRPLLKPAGFSNPIVPDPPLVRPKTASCSLTLISKYPFTNFTPATGTYAPPSGCPGPWSKVVLDVETSVSGVQFDRLGALWLGNTEIYRFTTSEPPGPAIHWHVAKDVTEYAATLSSANNFTYSLGNVVNATYTGIYVVTAKLTFYEPGKGWPAATTADAILPIANGQNSPPWFTLNTPSDQAVGSVIVPANSERAQLEVYATGHGCEEFWYANESTAFMSQLGSTCGGTAFREIDVFVDGKPAGVVFPFAYLYTGAIDPIAWLPITGHDALDIPAYQLDLTPFVGLLNDGQPHTIAAQVYNDTGGFWLADADLFVWDDHGATQTSGKLISVKAGPNPPEHYVEHLNPQTGGTATYWGLHNLVAKGYVTTSHGRVDSEVDEHLTLRNHQVLTQPMSPSGTEVVKMSTNGTIVDSLHGGGYDQTTTTTTSYPFYLSLTNSLTIDQSYASAVKVVNHGRTTQSTKNVDIAVSAGNGPQSTTEHYVLKDSAGYCYDRSLAASNGKLLSDTYACR
ncbi:MAG: peptide-N4-asparagine amidase [Candidatus Baltobacteraceae bacterium]